MDYSFCIPLSFNNLLHDNDSINDSLCLPDNNDNLLCGELFMLYLDDYRDYYALENKENTLKYDIIWLKKFFSLEVIKNKKITELEKLDIKEGLTEIYKNYKRGSGAVHATLGALRKYFYFLNDTRKKNLDITILKIKLPKKIQRKPKAFRFKDAFKLFRREYPNTKSFSERRDLIAFILYSVTGARKGELVGVKISDINFEENKIRIFQFKTEEYRTILIPPIIMKYIKSYLKERRSIAINNNNIFITKSGTPASINIFTTISHRFLVKYNIRFYLHQLRAGYVSDLYNNGNDITMASKLVGHKDIKTTSEHYLDVDNREFKKAAKRHPAFHINENKDRRSKKNIDIQYIKDHLPEIVNIIKNLRKEV